MRARDGWTTLSQDLAVAPVASLCAGHRPLVRLPRGPLLCVVGGRGGHASSHQPRVGAAFDRATHPAAWHREAVATSDGVLADRGRLGRRLFPGRAGDAARCRLEPRAQLHCVVPLRAADRARRRLAIPGVLVCLPARTGQRGRPGAPAELRLIPLARRRWRSDWISMGAHRDVDEALCRSMRIGSAGIQRCPTHGHVLYVSVDPSVRGPTVVWEEAPPAALAAAAAAAAGGAANAGAPRELLALHVIPARAGRMLRFRGEALHAVPKPALQWVS
eukprot:scaffold13594_cov88-Isochrysis_galbana.AAC.5